MTLDAARIDLSKAFVEGMGYVALSRVRSLDTLSLAGLNKMALRVSPEAIEIDTVLRKKSAQDLKKFEPLREAAIERSNKKVNDKQASTWGEKLARMREQYPQAFRPWKEQEDKKLKELYRSGKKPIEIAEALGRHPGSIRARLKKHYGEDWKTNQKIHSAKNE